MGGFRIRKGKRADSAGLLRLVDALAQFEHLDPPSKAGKKRLLDDIFRQRRIHFFVASDGANLVGYALYFYSYSSFLAKPTLYIEDLFVLEEHRGSGIGFALLTRCAEEAVRQRCGRMEWAVLTWNKGAIAFYEKLGARSLHEWNIFRLDENGTRKLSRADSEK